MRGTLFTTDAGTSIKGIIPAHAGNTVVCRTWDTRIRDHPRACGEHPTTSGALGGDAGSSPRMRGTLDTFTEQLSRIGIIPAHAGNTD